MPELPPLPDRTILLVEVGSTMHGIATGSDDRDEMGVCIEGPETVIGPDHFEQAIYRSAVEREGKPDARSQAGDLDRVVYSLRKFCRLALKGNPTVQTLLYVNKPLLATEPGLQLQDARDRFASLRVPRAFLGYMNEQLARLEGRRGQKGVKRPELVAAHGYDTKYAGHVLRLGYQGIAYVMKGEIPVPLSLKDRAVVLNVREGRVPLATVRREAARSKEALETLLAENPLGLPERPDYAWINDWMIRTHREEWGW